MNDINAKAHVKGKQALKGPGKAWEVDVDVYLTSVGPPPDLEPEFDMKACLPVDTAKDNNIIFYNQGRPGFVINFRLYDNTNGGAGSGYEFPNPPSVPGKESEWAMWSWDQPDCPPKDHGQWDEFTSQSVKDQGTTLVVVNKNETVTEFGYTLRVTNDNGKTFVDLDPGGNNQNGNNPV